MLKQISNYIAVVRKGGFHTVGKGDIKKKTETREGKKGSVVLNINWNRRHTITL